MTLAHIVNPIKLRQDVRASHLDVAQGVTLKSMAFSKALVSEGNTVELVAVTHQKENVEIPSGFIRANPICRYAYEFSPMLLNHEPKRRFVRICDILNNGCKAINGDYYIYSNIDIGLQLNFYKRIFNLLERGYDGLAINREDVPKEMGGHVLGQDDLEQIWRLPGKRHMGVDCVVFSSKLIYKMQFGNVFVGAPPVGAVLLTQVRRYAKKFKWIKNERLTFHLGEDKAWQSEAAKVFHLANKIEAKGLWDDVFRDNIFKRMLNLFKKCVHYSL
jgi:hypothetical protein